MFPAAIDDVSQVLDSYDLGSVVSIQRGGGTASLKYIVETTRERCVVKTRPSEFANPAFARFDHEILQRLSREGLPVPFPFQRPGGTTWLDLNGQMFEVLSSIEGEPFLWEDVEALRELGSFLSNFHRILSCNVPDGKQGWLREDHPDLMYSYVLSLKQFAHCRNDEEQLEQIATELSLIDSCLDSGLYASLPHSVIHGDMHPGNVRFRRSQVAALYDFDYLSWQARARDVVDCIMFFCARRETPLHPEDIRSLTQPFVPDRDRTITFLRGYNQLNPLTDAEWSAIPLVMRSRWIQIRLRGSRKVADDDRLTFVFHRFRAPIDWLDRYSAEFFDQVRESLWES